MQSVVRGVVYRETGDTCQLAVRIPRTLHKAIRRDAIVTDVTLSTWISDALARHLERVTAPRPRPGTEKV